MRESTGKRIFSPEEGFPGWFASFIGRKVSGLCFFLDKASSKHRQARDLLPSKQQLYANNFSANLLKIIIIYVMVSLITSSVIPLLSALPQLGRAISHPSAWQSQKRGQGCWSHQPTLQMATETPPPCPGRHCHLCCIEGPRWSAFAKS